MANLKHKLYLGWHYLISGIRHLFHCERRFYIGAGGDDAQDGLTFETRKLSLKTLESQLRPGDTVIVGPGPIGEPLACRMSGKGSKPIVYIADSRMEG